MVKSAAAGTGMAQTNAEAASANERANVILNPLCLELAMRPPHRERCALRPPHKGEVFTFITVAVGIYHSRRLRSTSQIGRAINMRPPPKSAPFGFVITKATSKELSSVSETSGRMG